MALLVLLEASCLLVLIKTSTLRRKSLFSAFQASFKYPQTDKEMKNKTLFCWRKPHKAGLLRESNMFSIQNKVVVFKPFWFEKKKWDIWKSNKTQMRNLGYFYFLCSWILHWRECLVANRLKKLKLKKDKNKNGLQVKYNLDLIFFCFKFSVLNFPKLKFPFQIIFSTLDFLLKSLMSTCFYWLEHPWDTFVWKVLYK